MGLITKNVTMKWNGRNKKWFIDKGYLFTKIGEEFEVRVEDLMNGSNMLVDCECENCGRLLKDIIWQDYLKCIREDETYLCQKCAVSHSISLQEWLIDHNHKDILTRWNYELNKYKPSEISYASSNRFWLNCLESKHKPELKRIGDFVNGHNGSVKCKQCDSLAQWGINNVCEDFLEKYWNWQENDELGINPWEISCGSNKKVWMKCQEKDYHKSYQVLPKNFTKGARCCFCATHKAHHLDSLGYLHPKTIVTWSSKNNDSYFKFLPNSNKGVWWKCPDGKHDDFKRKISTSLRYDFRCPSCEFSKGEKRVEGYLISNNIKYQPQKKFNNLLGLGNGKLSYDFYLVDYNLLIEYQGQQHEKYIEGFHASVEAFHKQQEHDKRKKEYAKLNNINLLEIWYYDFDNIEEILSNKLKTSQLKGGDK